MRVGYLLHYVRRGKLTGIERLGLATADALDRVADGLDLRILATPTAAALLNGPRMSISTLPGDWRLVGEQLVAPAWARHHRLHGLHVTAFGGPYLAPCPFVLTVFDSVFWDRPDSLSTLGRWYYRPLVERALRSPLLRGLVFISESARLAIEPHLPRRTLPHAVVYAASSLGVIAKQPRMAPAPDRPARILTVGTIEPRKNLSGMAAAVRALRQQTSIPIEWVHIGRRGWLGAAERDVLASGEVQELGTADDARLEAEFARATVFLSLSHLEGFNLPLAEALGRGTPAVVSDLPVHQEIGGAGAVLVPVGDPAAAAQAMRTLIESPDRWRTQSAAGVQHVQRFDIAQSATRLLELYQRVF